MLAMVVKWVFAWVRMNSGGTSSRDAMRNSAALIGSGEVAILLLGFGVTRWVIDAPVCFGILVYALLSVVLTPLVWHFTTIGREAVGRDFEATGKPRAPIYQ